MMATAAAVLLLVSLELAPDEPLPDASPNPAAAEAAVAAPPAAPAPVTLTAEDVARALVLEAAEAKVEAAAQEQRAEEAEEAAADATEASSSLKAGKLIQYGVTAGAGPALLVPLHTARNARPGAAATGLGYLMLHPAYWKDKPQTSTYCANHWALNGSAKAASTAADASALERAKVRMASLFALLRVDPSISYAALSNLVEPSASDRALAKRLAELARHARRSARTGGKRIGKSVDREVATLRQQHGNTEFQGQAHAVVVQLLAAAADHGRLARAAQQAVDRLTTARFDLRGVSAAQLETARRIVRAKSEGEKKITLEFEEGDTAELDIKDAEDALAREIQATVVGWKSDMRAKCGWHRFAGVWFGYPFPNFDVTVPARYGDADPTRDRLSVTSLGAMGFGISPNAYFSALVGVSLGLANLEPGDNDDELVTTFVLSLGGNLDLFTIFRGIAQ